MRRELPAGAVQLLLPSFDPYQAYPASVGLISQMAPFDLATAARRG
jgi:hypothetical protein